MSDILTEKNIQELNRRYNALQVAASRAQTPDLYGTMGYIARNAIEKAAELEARVAELEDWAENQLYNEWYNRDTHMDAKTYIERHKP